jgi:hypothetical protein
MGIIGLFCKGLGKGKRTGLFQRHAVILMGECAVFDPAGLTGLCSGLLGSGRISNLKGLRMIVRTNGIAALLANKDAHQRFLEQSHQLILRLFSRTGIKPLCP